MYIVFLKTTTFWFRGRLWACCRHDFKWTMIIAVIYATFAVAKRKPEKNSGLYGIRTFDLCDTGAVLFNSSLHSSHIWFSCIQNFSLYFVCSCTWLKINLFLWTSLGYISNNLCSYQAVYSGKCRVGTIYTSSKIIKLTTFQWTIF